ncbi:MAG: hypothetical protein ACM30G_13430 [Micromonosporaceae bacterium]
MATTVPTVTTVSPGPAPMPTGRASPVAGGVPAAWLLVAAGVALGLALRLPIATTVLGLAAFGVLHNVLELRYVLGRFDAILTEPFLWLLLGLISGVVACRLLPPAFGRPAEIVLCYSRLGVACGWVWRHRRRWLLAGALGLLALAGAASLAFPAYHFVVFTHLHNVVPLFFLWQWSASLPTGRAAVRAVSVGWVLGVPVLLLAGVFDRWLHVSGTGLAGFGGGNGFGVARVAGPLTPPVWVDTTLAVRFLAVFAFLQTMHYVVWVGVLPRYAPEAAARVPVLRGRRVWLVGIAGGLALGVLFALDYATGKTLYAAVASYHAYLEFPVLLALILGSQGVHR